VLIGQLAGRPRRQLVDQPVRSLLVETDHPVPQCLPTATYFIRLLLAVSPRNLAPEARKRGLKEVVAAARDTVTRASRTVMRALGIKSGRKGEAPGAARVKQAIANDSCSSGGPSIQPPQVSVSTTDTVARSLYAAVETLSKPSLNSDLKDELTRILSGIELDHDLDARRLNTPAAK